jgi:hypothetical protein
MPLIPVVIEQTSKGERMNADQVRRAIRHNGEFWFFG